MDEKTNSHWRTKLAAWTHDPAEKALVLMRDPSGHEGGTIVSVGKACGFKTKIVRRPDGSEIEKLDLGELEKIVARADHWAAAADRPQWPRNPKDGRYAAWTQVRFDDQAALIHPLSGELYELGKLDIDAQQIKAVSTGHFSNLIISDQAGEADPKRTALAFWRFGPKMPKDPRAKDLGKLWGLLPADTRIPDHTIWAHLDLTSAFATAFHADPEHIPALLTVSFGPVQDFIAQARTTSDLWAGSHLLSRIAWEGLKVVCADIGPDCVLFPQLRGVPQVDLWLRNEMNLPPEWFIDEEWTKGGTDANPLFAAALPNKFVAIVPASRACDLAGAIEEQVRNWTLRQTNEALEILLNKSQITDASAARRQINEQFEGFPEIHWTVVPWSPLITETQKESPNASELATALAPFYSPGNDAPGFLGSNVWSLLSKDKASEIDGASFFTPNPGVLYPALYDLLDRVQAAGKSVRRFTQLPQSGYRCSLCGEREWLTHDRNLLALPPGQRKESGSLWERVAGTSLARKGEHLCAPCTLKRLWPNLITAEMARAIDLKPSRFIVSTHTMALATSLELWLDDPNRKPLAPSLASQLQSLTESDTVALPRKLALRLVGASNEEHLMLRGLPLYLEQRKENLASDDPKEREKAESLLERTESELKQVFGSRPETYYALILMDGDRMGAWLSGQGEWGERYRLSFRDSWHPQIKAGVESRIMSAGGALARYPGEKRPVSPARHMAISSALNSFALHFARHIVEDVGKGKLIYAGGDDVLAMVSVDDLLSVMFLLRLAYSGIFPAGEQGERAWEDLLGGNSDRLDIRRGHIRYREKLYRVMGHKATASVGAVVAHHQAPLGYVLRKLRAAEKRAKEQGGRDAFAITLLKRSGGAVELTCPWLESMASKVSDWSEITRMNLDATPMGRLIRLRDLFAQQGFSRRAAYLTQGWLEDMPADPKAIEAMLGYQFRRQTRGSTQDKQLAETLGARLATMAYAYQPESPNAFVRDFLAVAEFLAREGRSGNPAPNKKESIA